MSHGIGFTLNGVRVTAEVDPLTPTAVLLRETFDLPGTKIGCAEGECGACTILVDGEAVNSCLLAAPLLDGAEVVTIEGITGADGSLHPVQRAFVDAGAVQCGFCTPGMVMRTVAFLEHHPDPTEEELSRSVEGNLCRCTGYVKILAAIRAAGGVR